VEYNLLKILSDENGADWHQKGEFKVVWHDTYAAMMSYYIEKVKFYGAKYMTSAAGMALKSTIVKSRKRHLAVPTVNEETLASFAEAEGLLWTIKEVEDFFGILREVTDMEDCETTVCPPHPSSF
jgi:hypothetical protein